MKRSVLLSIVAVLIMNQISAQVHEDETLSRDNNTAEWEQWMEESGDGSVPIDLFGVRKKGGEYGIQFNALFKNDGWRVLHGGVQNSTRHISNSDLLISVDLSKTLPVDEMQFFGHILGNNGGSISSSVGDLQKVSNIEGYGMLKVYQLWLQKNYSTVGLSFLFGIFDLNSEFYATPTSTLFLNGSHGVGIDLGQTGSNGPSIFPNTALAARIRYSPDENIALAVAIFDGHPGASDDCNRFDLTVTNADGYFLIGELVYENDEWGKYGAGVWYYTSSFPEVSAVEGLTPNSERKDNAGFYLLFDGKILTEKGDGGGSLSLFSRFGMTNHHLNAVRFHYGGGLSYQGLLNGRDDDVCGYAVAVASFGNDYTLVNRSLGVPFASFEIAHEFSYKTAINPWIALQPDIQYIVHPSGLPSIHNALVVGLHTEILF